MAKTYSRGLKYTPENTPFRVKLLGDKIYAFPSLTQLNVFKRDVENIVNLYATGAVLFTTDNKELSTAEIAVDDLYLKRYAVWLSE